MEHWNEAWILPQPAMLCWAPSFQHKNEKNRRLSFHLCSGKPDGWISPLRFLLNHTTPDFFSSFFLKLIFPVKFFSFPVLHPQLSAARFWLSRGELLSGIYSGLGANSNWDGGGLIVTVCCVREQIRIWIVLQAETQHSQPCPHGHLQPQMYTHANTHCNTWAASFWEEDKQLYIFTMPLPRITCTPVTHYQVWKLNIWGALICCTFFFFFFQTLASRSPDIQLLMCIDHIT